MISIRQYKSDDFETLLNFCKDEFDKNKNRDVSFNMWSESWQKDVRTLPYILKYTDRFSKHGKFYILYDVDSIVGCGGIYISDFSPKVALAGVRTWLNRSYRNNQYIRDILLPEQKKWAIEQGADVIALTFNEYNVNLRKLFSRGQNISKRTPDHIFYKNYNEVNYRVMIKGVPQWVIYENLTDIMFDWDSIRVREDYILIL